MKLNILVYIYESDHAVSKSRSMYFLILFYDCNDWGIITVRWRLCNTAVLGGVRVAGVPPGDERQRRTNWGISIYGCAGMHYGILWISI